MKRSIALAVITALFAAVYYFVIDGSIPRESNYKLDIDAVRALADAPATELPTEIRTEILARTPAPYFTLRAGGGFGQALMTRSVFQIVTDQGHFVLEAGMDLPLAEEYRQHHGFDEQVWLNIQDLLSSSIGIIVTHEHPDHIGGIVRHRNPAGLDGKLYLTRIQYDGMARFADASGIPPALKDYQPIDLVAPTRIAPGIVMIPAAGHTPGSVIFYMKLRSGDEYLFIGDIGYTRSNIYDGVDRARFVRFLMVDPENRNAVVHQLRTLHDLTKSEPGIVIVPAHADELLSELMANGSLIEGFALDAK